MHDELTAQDIAMMQKELDHRKLELMPELIEEVKRTRAFGDLSENFEYKAAKQAQNRNRSRIRYLERMIKSARVIEDRAADDEVGLFLAERLDHPGGIGFPVDPLLGEHPGFDPGVCRPGQGVGGGR